MIGSVYNNLLSKYLQERLEDDVAEAQAPVLWVADEVGNFAVLLSLAEGCEAFGTLALQDDEKFLMGQTIDPGREVRPSRSSARQLRSDLSDVLSLEPRPGELRLARRPLPRPPDYGGGSVGGPPRHLVDPPLALEGVGEADDDHPEVEEGRDEVQYRRLLAAVLGPR